MRALALPVAAITLTLAACGAPEDREGGISDDAAEIAEDSSTPGGRSNADVAGAPVTEGMRWFYKPATQTALFGSADSEGVISLSCNESMTGKTVYDFQWIAPANVGESRTVNVRSGDASGTIEVRGIASALGPDAIWQGGVQRGDGVVALLAGAEAPITFTLGDRSVTTPASEPLDQAIAACG